MSRGLGAVQRALLVALSDGREWRTTDLVGVVYRIPPEADGYFYFDANQHSAVRRALYGLERQGLVKRVGRQHAVLWMTPDAAAHHRLAERGNALPVRRPHDGRGRAG